MCTPVEISAHSVEPYLGDLTAGRYVALVADCPATRTHNKFQSLNRAWAIIARAVGVTAEKRVPVLILDERGVAWRHDAARLLITSKAMIQTTHRWFAFSHAPASRRATHRLPLMSTWYFMTVL